MWRNLLLSILLCSCATAAQLKPVRGTQFVHRGNHLARGLVAYWPMNEGGGTTVFDASGNRRHLTLLNGASYTQSLRGSCTRYDGDNDYAVNRGGMPFDGTLVDLTIGIWLKQNPGAGSQECWFSLGGANSYKNFIRLRCGGNTYPGQLFYDEFNDAGEKCEFPTDGTINFLNDGNWHHVVVTRNKAADEVSCYVDGVWYWTINSLVDMTNATITHCSVAALAYSSSSVNLTMSADIADVGIWSRALTHSEIRSLYRDPYQLLRREPVELYVTTGGAPPASTEQIQVITIASIPAGIVLLSLGVAYSDRRRAA